MLVLIWKNRVGIVRGKALRKFSRSLRRSQTEAEKKLWNCLRSGRFLGFKFRRQLPLGPYITDFCCLEKRLVVELDGSQHAADSKKDSERTKFLEKEGFQVVRIWDNEALANIEAVLEYLKKYIEKSPSPYPSPLKGEGMD